MNRINKDILRYLMITIAGLSLLLQNSTALSAQATGKTPINKPLSGQTSVNTTPLPSTIPSTEYQSIDKPSVKKLDIPDYDIAIRAIKLYLHKDTKDYKIASIKYRISAINKGTKNAPGMDVKITIYNIETNTLRGEDSFHVNQEIRHDLWTDLNERVLELNQAERFSKIKVKIEADPSNRYGESRENRLNNVYESGLWR